MRGDLQWRDDVVPEMIVVVAALLSLAASTHGFAFEEKPFVTLVPQRPADDAEFGASLAYYENDEDNVKIFLVGSPSDNNNRGALFSCPIAALELFPSAEMTCTRLSVDAEYLEGTNDKCEYSADRQRLGASLAVSGNQIMACAPNWENTCKKVYGDLYSALVGTCYTSSSALGPYTNFTAVYYYTNTQPDPRYYTTDGFCQAGFSVAFTQQGEKVVLGSPGCYAWVGDVFWGDINDKDSLQRRSHDFVMSDVNQGSTDGSTVVLKDRYMGYSVAEGIFDGRQMVVASAPKEGIFSKTAGLSEAATYILESDPTNSKHLRNWFTLFFNSENDWKFSYCGYSLAVVDFDQDGMDDVAVGCPHYGPDKGAFVIFFQRKNGTRHEMVKEPESRLGDQAGERFATAFAGIWDVDGDGLREFAVGAPGAKDGRGRVYIFCGEKGGLSAKACQILEAADDYKGLGMALVPGHELLAVSGVGQGVSVYRPRKVLLPVLQVKAETQLPVQGMDSVPVQVCLSYTIRDGKPDSTVRDFLAYLDLDAAKDPSRLQFVDMTANRTRAFVIQAKANAEVCESFDVQKKASGEYISTYELRANVSLSAGKYTDVVLDPRLPLVAASTLQPALECDGGTCTTDVIVSFKPVSTRYVYEDTQKLFINVGVSVRQDPAYLSKLQLDTHGALSYSAVEGVSDLQCQGTTEITCEAIYFEDTQVNLNFTLRPSQDLKKTITESSPEFLITVNFTSYSDFSTSSRPYASLSVPIALNVQFELTGSASPDNILAGETQQMNFTFELINMNSYDYTVKFAVVQANLSGDCFRSIDAFEYNTTACSSPRLDSSDLVMMCEYDRFSPKRMETVVLTALVEGKKGCQAPLEGTASFSKLPFGLKAANVAEAPSITYNDPEFKWYEKPLGIGLIVAGVAIVVLNITIVIVYVVKKKCFPDKEEGGKVQGGDDQGGEVQGDGEQDDEGQGAEKKKMLPAEKEAEGDEDESKKFYP